MGPCPIFVIEKRPLYREGLSRILESGNLAVIATLSSVDDLPAPLLVRDGPCLLVLGSRHIPAATAREITELKKKFPAARIVVLAENHDPSEVTMAFRAGADAYLADITCKNALIKLLELVINGERLMISGVLSMCFGEQFEERHIDGPSLLSPPPDDGEPLEPKADDGGASRLSERERMILNYLVAGAANKTIARRVGIAESTVKVHVKSILRKIGALNRTQAAIWATRNQFVPPSETSTQP